MAINTYVRKRDRKTMYRVRLRDTQGHWYGESFERRADAAQWERAEKSKKYQGLHIDPHKTFAAVAEEWLGSNLKKAENSLDKDRRTLSNHVLPVFGRLPIRKITATQIQDLVNSWWQPSDGAKSYHPESVRRMYSTVRAVFSFARRREYIVADRCLDIVIPDRTIRQIRVPMIEGEDGTVRIDMTPYQKLAVELGSYYGLMVDLALMGLRWGEIAGLQAQDFHFGKMRSTVDVQRQLTRGEKGRMTLKPKTKSYRATREGMVIPASLAEKIKAHITDHELVDGEFLFLSPDNRQLHYSNWRRNVWDPARDRVGMQDFHFHDLKRIATKLIDRTGVSDKVRESRLGNSVRVQNEVYDSVTSAEDWEAASALEDLIYGVSRNSSGRSLSAPAEPAPRRRLHRKTTAASR